MGKKKRQEPAEEVSEALSGLAEELEAIRTTGDMVVLAERAGAVLEGPGAPGLSEADRTLARRTLRSLRLDPVALGFFLAGLGIWLLAFTLGVVLRHG